MKKIEFADVIKTLQKIDLKKCIKSIEIIDGHYSPEKFGKNWFGQKIIYGLSGNDINAYINQEIRQPNQFWESGDLDIIVGKTGIYINSYILLKLHNLENFDVQSSDTNTWDFRITIFDNINEEFEKIKDIIINEKIKKSKTYFSFMN